MHQIMKSDVVNNLLYSANESLSFVSSRLFMYDVLLYYKSL